MVDISDSVGVIKSLYQTVGRTQNLIITAHGFRHEFIEQTSLPSRKKEQFICVARTPYLLIWKQWLHDLPGFLQDFIDFNEIVDIFKMSESAIYNTLSL